MAVSPLVVVPREYGNQIAINHARKDEIYYRRFGGAFNVRRYKWLLGYGYDSFPPWRLRGFTENLIYLFYACLALSKKRYHGQRTFDYRNAQGNTINQIIQGW